jgi:hypothetical protein
MVTTLQLQVIYNAFFLNQILLYFKGEIFTKIGEAWLWVGWRGTGWRDVVSIHLILRQVAATHQPGLAQHQLPARQRGLALQAGSIQKQG